MRQPEYREIRRQVKTKSPSAFEGNASSKDVSRSNRVRVLGCLLDSQVLSRVEIARITGMSPATVNRLTTSLLEMGLVEEAGSNDNTGGRPSLMIRFNPDARVMLAADINEATLDVAEVNLDGEIARRERLDISHLDPGDKLQKLADIVRDWTRTRPGDSPYVAVGVSIPGPVDASGTVSVAPALAWYDIPVKETLSRVTATPIVVENDVNLVAYAEYFRGQWGPIDSLVAIGVFQGIGAGIVESGRLWRGRGGAAAQFGRMLVDASGLTHQRIGFGHVETRLGSSAILERAVAEGIVHASSGTPDPVFEAASGGDEAALRFLGEIADEYAIHLANVCALVAPDLVVFAGLFDRWSAVMLPLLAERLEGNVLFLPLLAPAATGEDAKLVGAGLFALHGVGGIASLV